MKTSYIVIALIVIAVGYFYWKSTKAVASTPASKPSEAATKQMFDGITGE